MQTEPHIEGVFSHGCIPEVAPLGCIPEAAPHHVGGQQIAGDCKKSGTLFDHDLKDLQQKDIFFVGREYHVPFFRPLVIVFLY